MNDNRYPKKVFLWSQHLANNGIKNWYYKVKNICSKLMWVSILNLADQVCTRSLVTHVKDGVRLFVENRWEEPIFNDRRKIKMFVINCVLTVLSSTLRVQLIM